jgi:hypothetical protein
MLLHIGFLLFAMPPRRLVLKNCVKFESFRLFGETLYKVAQATCPEGVVPAPELAQRGEKIFCF